MQKNTPPDARPDQSFARPAEAADPIAVARRDLSKTPSRRFYKEVAVQQRDGTFVLLQDGRAAKSPGGNHLALPCLAAARALADEWLAQNETIDPAAMPLTRIVNSVIDAGAYRRNATADEIARYARADLVCYRAAGPTTLAEAQTAVWDPVLDFARKKLGAHFICTGGVVFVEQPEPARAAVKEAINRIANSGPAAPFALAALHVMMTLSDSVLLALAVAYGELTPTEAWIAAHVDEDFEMRAWGADAEALERRARQWRDVEAAAGLFQAVHGAGA